MVISSSDFNAAESIESSSSASDRASTRNRFEFRKEKCIRVLGRKVCGRVEGVFELRQQGNRLVGEVSGGFHVDHIGGSRFHKQFPIAPSCIDIPVVGSLGLQVCIENVHLPRKFDIVIKASFAGIEFEVWRRTIVLGAIAGELAKALGSDSIQSDLVGEVDGVQALAIEFIDESGFDGSQPVAEPLDARQYRIECVIRGTIRPSN